MNIKFIMLLMLSLNLVEAVRLFPSFLLFQELHHKFNNKPILSFGEQLQLPDKKIKKKELEYALAFFKTCGATKIHAKLLLNKQAEKKFNELFPEQEKQSDLKSLIQAMHIFENTYKHPEKKLEEKTAQDLEITIRTKPFGNVLRHMMKYQNDILTLKTAFGI